MVILVSIATHHLLSLIVIYLFFGGIIISFTDANRYYIFQTLPVKPKQIALARLIMIGINFTILLVVIVPIIIYVQTDLANIFSMGVALLLSRIFVFALFDITYGVLPRKRKKYLFLLFTFITPIVAVFIYITTIYFRKPELLMIMLIFALILVPILAFISIRTFLIKEIIKVTED